MVWNIVFVYLWTVFVIPAEFRKLCPASVQTPIRIKDPDDCTKYHLCVDMREFIVTCPEHYVVNERSLKCVPEGSVFDTCEYAHGCNIVAHIASTNGLICMSCRILLNDAQI